MSQLNLDNATIGGMATDHLRPQLSQRNFHPSSKPEQ